MEKQNNKKQVRKNIKKTNEKDSFVDSEKIETYTEDILKSMYNIHYKYYIDLKKLATDNKIKIRYPGLPEHISENIIKYIMINKLNFKDCSWDCKGDLIYEGNRFECKTFTSDGPISFGPKEAWNEIYFLDGRKWIENKYKLYKLPLANIDERFKKLNMSKTETFEMQSKQGRRPRINFDSLLPQVNDIITIVFDGSFEEIFNKVN